VKGAARDAAPPLLPVCRSRHRSISSGGAVAAVTVAALARRFRSRRDAIHKITGLMVLLLRFAGGFRRPLFAQSEDTAILDVMRLFDAGQAAATIRADHPVTCSDEQYQGVKWASCNVDEEQFMYQKIVVALDGSDSSRWALYEALKFAQLTQARLHAVYVVHPWCMSRYAGYFDPDQLRIVLRDDGRIALEEARRAMAERGMPGDTEIEETEDAADDIPHCLARCVQRQGAGLVVMGTQGRHGIGRMLLGSVAEAFLRHADVPVLLVRSPQDLNERPSRL
jgi:nucleotide-binding universal stress UspA family protein